MRRNCGITSTRRERSSVASHRWRIPSNASDVTDSTIMPFYLTGHRRGWINDSRTLVLKVLLFYTFGWLVGFCLCKLFAALTKKNVGEISKSSGL